MTAEIIYIAKSRLFHVSTVVFLLQLNSCKISKRDLSLSETCFSSDKKELLHAGKCTPFVCVRLKYGEAPTVSFKSFPPEAEQQIADVTERHVQELLQTQWITSISYINHHGEFTRKVGHFLSQH